MQRLLDDTFINDLQKGSLKNLLKYVKKDNTLDLHIRENYINIYYRGGNALRIEKKNGKYIPSFDLNYLVIANFLSESLINKYKETHNWHFYFPMVKQAIDFYLTKNPKDEREYQQVVVRENNYSNIASDTDYFIIDIEYDNRNNARFDLISIEWPAISSNRKLQKNFKPKLVVIEMKYGDKALSNSSGLEKHCVDFNNFCKDLRKVQQFKSEMIELLKQKRQLGLIPCLTGSRNNNAIEIFADEIELAILIANHKPAKTDLRNQLVKFPCPRTKFFRSNCMGYGLYSSSQMILNDLLEIL